MSAISQISSVPSYIEPTAEASTPASFSDVQPVLRCDVDNVSAQFRSDDSEADIRNLGLSEDDLAKGTLYVIDSELAFFNARSSKGFRIPYPNITLHALSGSSLYLQIDPSPDPRSGDDFDDSEDRFIPVIELTLIPEDTSKLEPIFEALSLCASKHPDPRDADEMDEDGLIQDGETDGDLSEVGRAALDHLESIIQYPPGHSAASDEEDEDDIHQGVINGR